MASLAAATDRREMKVLCLGLPRTGSTSMAEALTLLGYQNVYHTSRSLQRPRDWEILERAADATFPCLPSYNRGPFTRADWDELWGDSEATTDAAGIFAPELVRAYPEAKIVLVERDFGKWEASIFGSLFPAVWGPLPTLSSYLVEPVIGFRGGAATRKMLLGLFGSRDPGEARRRARETHEGHGRRLREMVEPGRLLVYRMGDGWGPLCEFLGREVPEVEFPRLNDADMLRRIARDFMAVNMMRALGMVLPWVVGLGAVGVGLWTMGMARL